jgi:hypothetical protein
MRLFVQKKISEAILKGGRRETFVPGKKEKKNALAYSSSKGAMLGEGERS